jgi:hypothetical protein
VQWEPVVPPPVFSSQTVAVNYSNVFGCRAASDEVLDITVFKVPQTGPTYYIPNDLNE